MAIALLDLDGGSAKLRGTVARRMLEVRPGLYVGPLSRRALEQLWEAVLQDGPVAALLIYPARNELGIGMRVTGSHRYSVVDHYGMPLIEFRREPRAGRSVP